MKKRKKTDKVSRWFATGSGIAKTCGVYLIEEFDETDPRWSVLSLKTGKAILWYHPAKGNWFGVGRHGSKRGETKDWRELFNMAIQMEQA